ncbi:urease accessory protein UreD [Leptothrix discophora]|uniref:Urease accessory protein UreD n=1 Tax=Leptothrix discophora TaxID=89 RepID=A0ABT9G2U4_LEPDI|nr:urease accessory protein UreD [Leptothrix discophora]MDP4300799.1 urease accessory protein UreD [Leptothrix discophora]
MSWHGHLSLDYHLDPHTNAPRTIAHDRHDGPLRVLQRLYPEGDAVCHHVLVHPPGGLVGGDTLDVTVHLAEGSHALVTTPGATRYYRSEGQPATQRVQARLDDGARLEWLPLETIAYDGCIARNQLRFELAPGAQMMGWDLLALGLPAADLAWRRGSYEQRIELPGCWLEQARLSADDHALLDSPLGWAGQRVLGTFWLAAGSALPRPVVEQALDAARALLVADATCMAGTGLQAGVSAAQPSCLVLRVLAPRVEPAMKLMTAVWSRWREIAWDRVACPPRVWST